MFQTDNASVLQSITANLAAVGINIPADAVTDLQSLDACLRVAVANKTAAGGSGSDDGMKYTVKDGGPPALMSATMADGSRVTGLRYPNGQPTPIGKVVARRSAETKEVESRQLALAKQFSAPKPKKAG